MRRIAYILFFFVLAQMAVAKFSTQQQVLKVVTRVVEKEFRYADEFLLEINAEKADIDIKVVEGNVVKINLEQSAMNGDVRMAERELGYIHFVEKKERNRLYLHNYAQLKANSSGLSSIINNKYTIEVPRHCHIKISNELGEIVVNDVSSTMRFELNYCGLVLNRCQGQLYVDSRIGDVKLNDCQLDAEFITENVNLKLQRVGGSFEIQSHFGDFSCQMSEQVSLINAKLEQCEATIINRTGIEYTYAIEVSKGHISALDATLNDMIEETENKTTLRRNSAEDVGTIIIKSEYGDVNLY